MKKSILFLFAGALMLIAMPACKKNVLSEKRTVEVSYLDKNAKGNVQNANADTTKVERELAEEKEIRKVKAGEELAILKEKVAARAEARKEKAEKKAQNKLPKLTECKAKRLINALRKQNNEVVYYNTIPVGYFECNSAESRLLLKKLEVNNIITLSCSEIMNGNQSTYWVNVALTPAGQKLVLNNIFPEDQIDVDLAMKELTPSKDQDEWGVPSRDANVDSAIVASMTQFYRSFANGGSINESLLSANLATAVRLNDALKAFESSKQLKCPFNQEAAITNEMVDSMKIVKLPRLVNAYLLSIGDMNFLYVISQKDGVVVIEDVVFENSKDIATKPTFTAMCSVWKESDLIGARKDKEKKDKAAAEKAERDAKKNKKGEVEEEEHYDMGNLCAYQVEKVKHAAPRLYDEAKKQESITNVNLLAYKYELQEILSIDVTKDYSKKVSAVSEVILVKKDVNALGRIFYGVSEGEETKQQYNFNYYNVAKWSLK